MENVISHNLKSKIGKILKNHLIEISFSLSLYFTFLHSPVIPSLANTFLSIFHAAENTHISLQEIMYVSGYILNFFKKNVRKMNSRGNVENIRVNFL